MNADITSPAPKKKSSALAMLLVIMFFFGATLYIVFMAQKGSYLSDKNLVEKAESLYNNIFIYKDEDGRFHMTFGYRKRTFVESVHNPKDPLELYAQYTRLMTLGLAYTPERKDLLLIGMGGGKISGYVQHYIPELHAVQVEIDPEVVNFARKYFELKEGTNSIVATTDGRKFLMQDSNTYNIIMLDAYRGPFVPFHLMTQGFFQLVKQHMKPGGVVVQNIDPSTMLFDSSAKTMSSVFDHMDYYFLGGNVVAIGYDGATKTPEELQKTAAALQEHYKLRYDLTDMLKMKKEPAFKADAPLLTDDFAPVDSLKSIEEHNRKWSE